MKKALCWSVIALVLLLGGGGVAVWRYLNRPNRPAVIVGSHILTAQELEWRAQTMLEDAKRAEHLVVPAGREAEALRHYARDVARMWIVKAVLLGEADRRNIKASPLDVSEQMASSEAKIKRMRGKTMEQFFKEGPLPEAIKRQDFEDVVRINKLCNKEIRDKIVVKPAAVEERLVELQRLNLVATKKGEKPKISADRKTALDLIRAERYNQGFRRFFRALYPTAHVKSPEFPELEKLEGVSPERPEDKAH